ncbi:MAG: dihydrofolate reductase, partial [Flavobacteriales bacterium]|nr:dihydrofolate reductase [Flavobacteriales bacterium]
MYITHVKAEFEADVFFPETDFSEWEKEILFSQEMDEKHKHAFEVVRYFRP